MFIQTKAIRREPTSTVYSVRPSDSGHSSVLPFWQFLSLSAFRFSEYVYGHKMWQYGLSFIYIFHYFLVLFRLYRLSVANQRNVQQWLVHDPYVVRRPILYCHCVLLVIAKGSNLRSKNLFLTALKTSFSSCTAESVTSQPPAATIERSARKLRRLRHKWKHYHILKADTYANIDIVRW